MNEGKNIYRTEDVQGSALPAGPKVFLSHRAPDKPVARAIASVLSALDVHYWLDENDRDLQRAAALGWLGDSRLVHAIERGVRHCTALLGLLSGQTVGSWWVPYEIGYSRAAGKSSSFLMFRRGADAVRLPEYATVSAVYWSIDELARWASTLNGHDLHADLTKIPETPFEVLARYVPLDPPRPDIVTLCEQAIRSIALLANADTQSVLALTSRRFDWLPTDGGSVRDIAYDLFAPLACFRLGVPMPAHIREQLAIAFRIPTLHHALARREPPLPYSPEVAGWRSLRYGPPSVTWRQGLHEDQLAKRLDRFLMTRNRIGELRLATKEEFKAEFDRVLASTNDRHRHSLGVLVNPLFGFTPTDRPVFWRVLAVQYELYSRALGVCRPSPFDHGTKQMAQTFVANSFR